jgi:hypothetical protein
MWSFKHTKPLHVFWYRYHHRLSNKFWCYVAVCVQLHCRWFAVLRLVVAVLHCMFRPTWPSSGVYDVLLLYSWRNLLRCFCFPFLHVVTLCTFSFVLFCCVFSLVFWFLCACLPACHFLLSGQTTRNVRQRTIYNKAARRRQHNLKTYWAMQCSRMLKYSIID